MRITDAAGDLVASQELDVWGARRSEDWRRLRSEFDVPEDVRRGYTGHEHDDEFGYFGDGAGVINMGGRTYDSYLRRFTSGDPIVAAPNHGPSWNRYSYALNNPTRYTDPSGQRPNDPSECDPLNPWCNRGIDTDVGLEGGCYEAECGNSPNGPFPGGNDPGDGPGGGGAGGGGHRPPAPQHQQPHYPTTGSQTPNAASPAGATGRSTGIGTTGGPLSASGPGGYVTMGRLSFDRQSIASQVAGGIWDFAAGTVSSLFNMVFHPVDTFTAWKDRILQGWQEDGLLGAFNYGFNPAYQFLIQADAAIEAWNRGDIRGAVSNGLGAGVTAAGTVAGVAGGVGAVGRAGSNSIVYQLVDEAGDAVYYGKTRTSNLERTVRRHANNSPGPWNGLQVISHRMAEHQALALETSLIQSAIAEKRTIYNVAPRSISEAKVQSILFRERRSQFNQS